MKMIQTIILCVGIGLMLVGLGVHSILCYVGAGVISASLVELLTPGRDWHD